VPNQVNHRAYVYTAYVSSAWLRENHAAIVYKQPTVKDYASTTLSIAQFSIFKSLSAGAIFSKHDARHTHFLNWYSNQKAEEAKETKNKLGHTGDSDFNFQSRIRPKSIASPISSQAENNSAINGQPNLNQNNYFTAIKANLPPSIARIQVVSPYPKEYAEAVNENETQVRFN